MLTHYVFVFVQRPKLKLQATRIVIFSISTKENRFKANKRIEFQQRPSVTEFCSGNCLRWRKNCCRLNSSHMNFCFGLTISFPIDVCIVKEGALVSFVYSICCHLIAMSPVRRETALHSIELGERKKSHQFKSQCADCNLFRCSSSASNRIKATHCFDSDLYLGWICSFGRIS